MMAYELMIKTNRYLISGGELTEHQKRIIAGQLIGAAANKETAMRFYKNVKFPGNIDGKGRRMYPLFYIPPHGKKLMTLMTQTPKTHLFSANMYELEILRLLAELAPSNKTVSKMLLETKARLKTTCFGKGHEGVGECFDISLIVLRFLASTFPDELEWMNSRINVYHAHFNEKPRVWCVKWYYWLCLSEMPEALSIPEIKLYKDELLSQISRSAFLNKGHDKNTYTMLFYIVKNCLSRLPENAYSKGRASSGSTMPGKLRLYMV